MPAMMLVAGGAAAIGGSVISGLFGSSAAKKQAKAIRYAADKAQQTAYEIDKRQRADIAPFRQYGIQAGDTLMNMLTGQTDPTMQLEASPLYQFQQQQGTRDINRQLAARGMQHSGAGLETLQRFTNQLVGEEGERYYNRLFNLTQLGSNAATHQAGNTAQIGSNLMGVQAQLGSQYGQAQAAGQLAWGNALGGSLAGLGQTIAQYPMYQASMGLLNRMQPQAQTQPSMSQFGPYQSGYQFDPGQLSLVG